ncbi:MULTISPECIES: nucleotidyltransferase family protein [unclassified Luteococcus]|uniref:nucleotidyltransferase family protein n=1 Tax=unclassified Luteococcus TaxID=2639923 RepID=UPI00313C5BA9
MEELADQIRAAVVRRYGTGCVHVFGSVARGDDGPDSDVDLLVESTERASLFDQVGLEQDLAELLGRRVDVVSLRATGRVADRARATAVPLCGDAPSTQGRHG